MYQERGVLRSPKPTDKIVTRSEKECPETIERLCKYPETARKCVKVVPARPPRPCARARLQGDEDVVTSKTRKKKMKKNGRLKIGIQAAFQVPPRRGREKR